MTILDKILKARELVASIEGCGDGGCLIKRPTGMHTNGGCRCYRDPLKMQRALQAITLIRDPELLALGEEVERLRLELGCADDYGREWREHCKAAEANFAQAIQDMRRKDALIEAAEAKLAAAEVDAMRYRYWRENHGWTGYFDCGASNGETAAEVDAAIDAAMRGEGE